MLLWFIIVIKNTLYSDLFNIHFLLKLSLFFFSFFYPKKIFKKNLSPKMVNYKINNLKSFNPSINKILSQDRYDTEDVSEVEKLFVQKQNQPIRTARSDLKAGDIVVVLEGLNTGKRVVFIQQLPGFKALVSGVSTLNGASLFKIDERYLLKLGSKIEVPTVKVNLDNVYESMPNENEKVEAELSSEEKEFEKQLYSAITKVPYMKSYLAESFKVDHSVEFYSQEY